MNYILVFIVFLLGFNIILITEKEVSKMMKVTTIIFNLGSLFITAPIIFILSILGLSAGFSLVTVGMPILMVLFLILPQIVFSIILAKKKTVNLKKDC